MKTIPSTEAKTNFGALLDTARREPVTIEKKGRAVAVIMSIEEYNAHQALKPQALQQALQAGIEQADRGELMDGDEVFEEFL